MNSKLQKYLQFQSMLYDIHWVKMNIKNKIFTTINQKENL